MRSGIGARQPACRIASICRSAWRTDGRAWTPTSDQDDVEVLHVGSNDGDVGVGSRSETDSGEPAISAFERWHAGGVRPPRPTTARRAAGILALAAGISYLTVEAMAASRVPAYSYLNDVVSDLGRPTSPLSWWMNAAFRVQGMAFVITAAIVVATSRPKHGALAFTAFACLYGAGSVLVGLVPSGAGGTAQLLHVAGASAAIVGGNLALVAAGRIGLPDPSTAARALGYALGGLGLT